MKMSPHEEALFAFGQAITDAIDEALERGLSIAQNEDELLYQFQQARDSEGERS
jgi:hypothetical protein